MNWICWNIHNLSKKCVYLWVKSHWVLRKHSEYIVPSINQNLSLVHNHPSFSHLKSTNYKLFTLFLCPDISLIALHVWFLSPVLGLPCLHIQVNISATPSCLSLSTQGLKNKFSVAEAISTVQLSKGHLRPSLCSFHASFQESFWPNRTQWLVTIYWTSAKLRERQEEI